MYKFIRSIVAHTKQIACSIFHCLVWARIVCLKSTLLAHTKQWHANVEVFWPCGNVTVVIIWTRLLFFSHVMNLNTVTPTDVWARSAFWAIETDGSLKVCVFGVVLSLRLGAPLCINLSREFKSASILWKSLTPLKIRHMSLSEISDNLHTGRYVDGFNGFIISCSLLWFWHILWYKLARSEKQRRWGAIRKSRAVDLHKQKRLRLYPWRCLVIADK